MFNVTPAQAQHRFDDPRGELACTVGSSVSVGFSELLDTDSMCDFVGRADNDLLTRRASSR